MAQVKGSVDQATCKHSACTKKTTGRVSSGDDKSNDASEKESCSECVEHYLMFDECADCGKGGFCDWCVPSMR
jgi:hypothetical protein